MSTPHLDTIFDGRVIVEQPDVGYRFSIDPLLLIAFAYPQKTVQLAIDLGAGCGVVGLGLLVTGRALRVVGVEIQERLADMALANALRNGFEKAYEMERSDVREASLPSLGKADLVVCNPPFWPVWEGRMPPDEERRIARHEVLGSLGDWIHGARRVLHPTRGRLCIVYPARRVDELLVCMHKHGMSGTRLRFVFSMPRKPAEQVLLEARLGKLGRLNVEPPLLLKDDDGADTKELLDIVSGGFSREVRELSDTRKVSD